MRAEEVRLAIVSDNSLEDYQIEVAETDLRRGNIYRGVVGNIEPSLNAAFIEFGAERHGFLASHDVVPGAWHRQPREPGNRPRIEQILERGREVLVQVTKDAEGTKGAALTTDVSLAGRYIVLMPYAQTRGISRKVDDDSMRKKIRSVVEKLEVPEDYGFIVRTAAMDQTKTALNRDLNSLVRLWKRILTDHGAGSGSRLLYSDQDLVVTALRDYLDATIEELLVDDDDAFKKAESYMQAFMPRSKTELKRYRERIPLFSRFNLEPQIERIYRRSVNLPSGGSLVIDRTEALTAVDVNSGKANRGQSHEETIFNTNMEAAAELARQLRLRDIGGLVVVDFIDMRIRKHQREVEKALKEEMKTDRARFSVGRISPNGLLEINRQRIKKEIRLRTHRICPTCEGVGRIASAELVGLSLLRRLEARAATGTISGAKIWLHPELADSVQNNRRLELTEIEREFDIDVEIYASPALHRSEEKVEWMKKRSSVDTSHLPVSSVASAADFLESGDDNTAKKKKRRRKKKKRDDQPAQDGATESQARPRPSSDDEDYNEAGDEDAVETLDGELLVSDGDEGDDPQPDRKKKRRRRRKKRKRPVDGQVDEAGNPVSVSGEDAKESTAEPRTEQSADDSRAPRVAAVNGNDASRPTSSSEDARDWHHGETTKSPAQDNANDIRSFSNDSEPRERDDGAATDTVVPTSVMPVSPVVPSTMVPIEQPGGENGMPKPIQPSGGSTADGPSTESVPPNREDPR